MQTNYVALAVVAAYMAALGLLTSIVQRSVTTATTFTSGTTGSGVPAVLVGLMLMAIVIFAPGGLMRGVDLARRRRARRRG